METSETKIYKEEEEYIILPQFHSSSSFYLRVESEPSDNGGLMNELEILSHSYSDLCILEDMHFHCSLSN